MVVPPGVFDRDVVKGHESARNSRACMCRTMSSDVLRRQSHIKGTCYSHSGNKTHGGLEGATRGVRVGEEGLIDRQNCLQFHIFLRIATSECKIQ